MKVHYLVISHLCFWSLFLSVSFCESTNVGTFQVVGSAECADCKMNNLKTHQAFTGLHVTIDCKLQNGNMKTVGKTELNEQGYFKISLPKEIVHENGQKLKEQCYAQLHNAAAMPCPAPGSLEASKIVFKSQNTFAPTNTLLFSATLCTSKFFWPHPWFRHPWFQTPPVYTPPVVNNPPVVMPQPPEAEPLPPPEVPINTPPPMEEPLPPPAEEPPANNPPQHSCPPSQPCNPQPPVEPLPPPVEEPPANNHPKQPCPPTEPGNQPPMEPLPPTTNEPPAQPLPPPVPGYQHPLYKHPKYKSGYQHPLFKHPKYKSGYQHPLFKHPKYKWPPIPGHQ